MPAVRPARRRTVRRAAAAALLGLALAAPGPAQAFESRLMLDYRVYVGGFRTVDMVFDSRVAPDAYSMKLKLDARGFLEWFFTWSMTAASEGRLEKGRVVPLRASSRSNWKGEVRRIDVEFPAGGGVPKSSVAPTPKEDDREPVPDALRRGTIDLAAAIVALLRHADRTGRCDYTARVFDGRRRYDLVFAHQGSGPLPANQFSAFSGPALRCSLRLERIAGFRKNRSRLGWATSDGATVWLARLFPGTRPVPVRIELETIAGTLLGHIEAATLSGDGVPRRISRSD